MNANQSIGGAMTPLSCEPTSLASRGSPLLSVEGEGLHSDRWLGRTFSIHNHCICISSALGQLSHRIQTLVASMFAWIRSLYQGLCHVSSSRGVDSRGATPIVSDLTVLRDASQSRDSSAVPVNAPSETGASESHHLASIERRVRGGRVTSEGGGIGAQHLLLPRFSSRARAVTLDPTAGQPPDSPQGFDELSDPVGPASFVERRGIAAPQLTDAGGAESLSDGLQGSVGEGERNNRLPLPSELFTQALDIPSRIDREEPLPALDALSLQHVAAPPPILAPVDAVIPGSSLVTVPTVQVAPMDIFRQCVLTGSKCFSNFSLAPPIGLTGKKLVAYQELMRDRTPIAECINSVWSTFEPAPAQNDSLTQVHLFRLPPQPILNESDVVRSRIQKWVPNFGNDRSLFCNAYQDVFLLGASELQVLEHPILLHIKAAACQDSECAFAEGRLNGRAICFESIPRHGRLDLSGGVRELFLERAFESVPESLLRERLQRMDPPDQTNIFVMESPVVEPNTQYTKEGIAALFTTVLHAFAMLKVYYDCPSEGRIYVPGGDWGAQAYGHNPCLIQLLQMAAARIVGVSLGADQVSDDALRLFERHQQEHPYATVDEYLEILVTEESCNRTAHRLST